MPSHIPVFPGLTYTPVDPELYLGYAPGTQNYIVPVAPFSIMSRADAVAESSMTHWASAPDANPKWQARRAALLERLNYGEFRVGGEAEGRAVVYPFAIGYKGTGALGFTEAVAESGDTILVTTAAQEGVAAGSFVTEEGAFISEELPIFAPPAPEPAEITPTGTGNDPADSPALIPPAAITEPQLAPPTLTLGTGADPADAPAPVSSGRVPSRTSPSVGAVGGASGAPAPRQAAGSAAGKVPIWVWALGAFVAAQMFGGGK